MGPAVIAAPPSAAMAGFLQRLNVAACGYCPWRPGAGIPMLVPEPRAMQVVARDHDQETP